MVTHTPPVAGNLPMKKRNRQQTHTKIHSLLYSQMHIHSHYTPHTHSHTYTHTHTHTHTYTLTSSSLKYLVDRLQLTLMPQTVSYTNTRTAILKKYHVRQPQHFSLSYSGKFWHVVYFHIVLM